MDDMKGHRDYLCGCGLINNSVMGVEVVVAGYGTSEIFNFDDLAWRDGPNLPIFGHGYASVQLTNTFLLVGGYEDNAEQYSDKIFIFDEDDYSFTLMSQTLVYPRNVPAAVLVPDEFVNCS